MDPTDVLIVILSAVSGVSAGVALAALRIASRPCDCARFAARFQQAEAAVDAARKAAVDAIRVMARRAS
jgi:hypothetical protein